MQTESQKRTGLCPQVDTIGGYGEHGNEELRVERKVF